MVLLDRGTCPFAQKEDAAAQRGAVAMIVADNVDEQQMGGTLGANTDVKIPVVGVTKSVGVLLRGQPGPSDRSSSMRAPKASRPATSSRRPRRGRPPTW